MTPADALGALWGSGVHSLCSSPPHGAFQTQGFHATPDELLGHARDLATGGHDVWFGVNPLASTPERGRGRSDDVAEVAALYVDLDWRDDVHASTELPTEIEVRSVLDTSVAPPSMIVHSGHGLHGYWFLTSPIPPVAGQALQERLHAELKRRGLAPERHDLASVLRVPGTRNYKSDDRLVVIEHADLEALWHPAQLWELLEPPDEPTPPEPPPTAPPSGGGISRRSSIPTPYESGVDETPADWYNAHTPIRDLLGRYGWTYHSTDQEGELWVRPGKDSRQGVSARVYETVVVVFTTHFPQLCARDNEVDGGGAWRHDAFELYAAMEHGGDKMQAASNIRRTMMPQAPRTAQQQPLSSPQSDETVPGGTAGAGLRRIRAVKASSVEAENVTWLWPGRLPRGKLVVLDGDPSIGKSVLTLDVAARVSGGRPWPDESYQLHPAGNSLIVTAEDGLRDTVVPRLVAAEADLDRIHLIEVVETGMYDINGRQIDDLLKLPSDVDLLYQYIVDQDIRLVVLDVLAAFMEQGYDMNSDQDVRAVMSPLARVAEATGATVVSLRHLNKKPGVSAMYRGGGSIGITGAARVGMLAAWHPEDIELDDLNDRRKVLAVAKSNIAAYAPSLSYTTTPVDDTVRLAWGDPVGYTADELVNTPARSGDQEDRNEMDEFLRILLKPGPRWVKEIEKEGKHMGFTISQLRRASKRIGGVSKRSGVEDQWYWILKDDHSDQDYSHGE